MTEQLTLKIKGEVRNNKIWGTLQFGEIDAERPYSNMLSGWVPFIFQKFTGNLDRVNTEISIPVEFVKSFYQEHSNGGRLNQNTYNNVAEYMADPKVKEMYLIHLAARGDIEQQLQLCGEPEHLDLTVVVSYCGAEFSLNQIVWDAEAPTFEKWFSDFFVSRARELSTAKMFKSADAAVTNIDSSEDLFGERYFPVAKFDLSNTTLEAAKDVCYSFKGYSKPIIYDGQAYIGIRSKLNEICNISEIYEVGGKILKGEEWNW